MPTTLDADGIRLFNYLLNIALTVKPEAGEGFVTYLAAHKVLGLSKDGFTWGDSLDKQGMGKRQRISCDNRLCCVGRIDDAGEGILPLLRQRQEKTGISELFGAPVLYRERKYQQLAEDNRVRAKKRVWDLLSASGELPYDDCSTEALQFPAAYQIDLRDWPTEWEKAGRSR